jgi:4-hydroxy-4-methyl-2-oxoglutarate aldolase
MTEPILDRLGRQDTNTISDALDFLELPGATVGIRPLWNCPRIVGRVTTIQLAPKTDPRPGQHILTPTIAANEDGDRILVISGAPEGISCWGDIVANAAQMKKFRGTVIDGFSRDIEGSESIGYPVYGRGLTMVSARNRLTQVSAGGPLIIGGVTVRQDDYLIADRCGTVFIPAGRISDVLDMAERIERRQAGMVAAVRSGRSIAEVMHDKEFNAIAAQR